ncbi:capsid protein [Cercopithecine alphaherpesvirus 9]|uniref:Capsid protein n=1 Tax=Cercopithecine herpesvirus 9 (strain DHV) TaxID=36348 RepID=Q9E1Z5_CHV9D|nr:capsid triplex subunit 1 [Cercopithecine alphaherpesvirus 9]AAG27193.1 capsid protein [Cercopithecine alphaherpesvirus 9]
MEANQRNSKLTQTLQIPTSNVMLMGDNRFIQIGNGLNMSYNSHNFRSSIKPWNLSTDKFTNTANGTLVRITPDCIVINNAHGLQIQQNTSDVFRLPLEQTHITPDLIKQVSLTDLCRPDVDFLGSPVFLIRHCLDIVEDASVCTPAGRRPENVVEALRALSGVCTAPWTVGEGGGLRACLISINFLTACRADEYADKQSAEAIRAAVISAYSDRRMEARLTKFSEYLQTMVQCHLFPHRYISFFGSLANYTIQDDLCNVTCIARGFQESMRTQYASNRRITANVPACVFWDVDRDLHLSSEGFKNLYLLFVYTQRYNREGVRMHIALSQLNETSFGNATGFLLGRIRAENVMWGTEGVDFPQQGNTSAFPLIQLTHDPTSPRCSIGEFTGDGWQLTRQRLYQWTGDFRGLPTQRSCLYAAYTLIGRLSSDNPRYARKMERLGDKAISVVWLEGVKWDAKNSWYECYY